MLNPFPDLLTYGFFAPTLLRFVAAVVFVWIAYYQWRHRDELAKLRFPLIGSGAWIVWVTIILEVITAAGLLFGYQAQYVAILGALFGLKYFVWGPHYQSIFPLSRVASAMLFVICLSLLLSGAGAWAFDLRL